MIPIRRTTKFKATAVVAGCAAAGAIAGIAGAAASPSSTSSKTNVPEHSWRFFRGDRLPGPGAVGLAGGGPAVHETAVVLNKAGTGFITATEDSGTVQSVSGDQLTIKEGIGNVTYKTVTLTIPSGATIYRDFATSSLSALKSGDHVRVVQSSEGTSVVAISSNFTPPDGHMPFGPERRWNGSAARAAPGSYGPPPDAPVPPTA